MEDWVTVAMSPQEIIESLQREFLEQAKKEGIKLFSIDSDDFSDWAKADKRSGGYFTVRRAFEGIFKNGLKPTESLETLKECDFRFSPIPKHDLETGYRILPVAFELAPVLTPRYNKDGIQDKVALKFVMHVPQKSSLISIRVLPYQKLKAEQKAEEQRKQIKKMSSRQWAIAKSYRLRKAIGGFRG